MRWSGAGPGHDVSAQEREANDFAARTLIAPADMTRFIGHGDASRTVVQAFAAAQGVASGIVVGQLQHRGVVPFRSALSMPTSFRWHYVHIGAGVGWVKRARASLKLAPAPQRDVVARFE